MFKIQVSITRSLLLSILFFTLGGNCIAQGGDTAAKMRTFLSVSNSYKRFPLRLTIIVSKTTDLPGATSADAQLSTIDINMDEKWSYMRMDDIEQVVNDSLMLMVSSNDQRMALFPNHTSVAEQIRMLTGLHLRDSSVKNLFNRYKIIDSGFTILANGAAQLAVASRSFIAGGSLPKEFVVVRYDAATFEPEEVIQTQRKMVLLDSVSYHQLQADSRYQGKLLKSGTLGYFLIKTETVRYLYIKQDAEQGPGYQPMTSYIRKETDGHYQGVGKYAGFTVTENL